MVDTIVPPRSHEHESVDVDAPAVARSTAGQPDDGTGQGSETVQGSEAAHLSGRTRQNKLVHLTGRTAWLGTLVRVRVEHAGPYALRGSAVAHD
jgi:hypothetical protein